MDIQLFRPNSSLSDYIEAYSLIRNPDANVIAPERFAPSATGGLVINLNSFDPNSYHAAGGEPIPHYAYLGPLTQFTYVHLQPNLNLFLVKFSPTGFYHLFGLPAAPYVNAIVDLFELQADFGWLTSIMPLIHDLPPGEIVKQFDQAFMEICAQSAKPPGAVERSVQYTWQTEAVATTTVESLAQREGISRRHLNRLFVERVGLTPKLFLRLARFERVVRQIRQRQQRSLDDVLFECGYFDYSHFLKDFHSLLGVLPQQFKQEPRLIADFLYSI